MSMNRETEMLLQSGIAAVRGGDKREGARLLAQVVRREPQSEDAWFWLAAATDQPAEAAACLRRVLAINPNNSRARQALEMLDSGQGNTAFSGVTGGPAAPEVSPLRPLNTGELLSPPTSFNPPPPPPPFTTGPTPTPGLGEASFAPPPPPSFGTPSWAQNEAGSPPRPPLPGDPYSTASAPSSLPQSNLPPPPPFTGGGVRLGQLDPEAAAAQAAAPQQAGPAIYDPGAELRASLMPNIPPSQQGAPLPVQPQPARPARRGFFQRRGANPIPAAAPTVIVNNNQQRRRVRPFLLALAILAIFVAAIAGILLWQRFGPGSNTATTEAGVTTTVDTTAGTTPGASPGGTTTGGAAGTGAAGTGVAGTGAAGTGAAGTGTIVAGNSTGGTSGAGSLTTTPRPGATTVAGNQPNTTPGAGGLTPGSLPPGGTAGSSTALSPTPSQAANTTAGAGTVGPGLTATAQPPAFTTVAPTTFTDQPPTTPAVTVPGGTLVPVTTAPGQTTPVTAGEPPPTEVQKYLANTNTYLTYSQYFEMAVAEGIVKPYRAGQIKPGVTRINWPAISYYYIRPTIAASTTAASTTTATTTATATATTATVTTSDSAANTNRTATTTATTTAATTTAATTPAVTTASTSAAGTTAAPSTTAVPPNFTGIPIVIDGPEGPQVYIYYGGANQYEVSLMTMSIGRLARIMKDQPTPREAYELNQVALEYANDLSGIANALDLFFQSGQITYLDQVSILYDKAVRDRTRWTNIVDAGYPYRITQ